jgi:crotonobetainyl-CoA:carnitine CoA-transferase CaiB-like acyl-CoA transferase
MTRPGAAESSPEAVGEHTGKILAELGYDDATIAWLRARSVI